MARGLVPMNRFDFYFTRPDPLRGKEDVVDFGGKSWNVEIEFKECMCPNYDHSACDGV